MRKAKIFLTAILILLFIPLQVGASDLWTGNGICNTEQEGEWWGVTSDEIVKVTDIDRVYSIDDMNNYSAYISHRVEDINRDISEGFRWYNRSRLGYVKLLKVSPGQDVSFLFSGELYVYCAEFTDEFTLIQNGIWMTTGDKFTLQENTEWIVLVFRKPNGSLEMGSGTDTVLSVDDISELTHKYLILEPFQYTFRLNGGEYNNDKDSFSMERLGVTAMELPIPKRDGYVFTGWKAQDGNVYSGMLPVEYNRTLFDDAVLDATWAAIEPSQVVLNRDEVVFEENSDDTLQLEAKVYPENVLNGDVTWSSMDENVVTVDDNGLITPKNHGVTVIKATASNGISAECRVYVMGFEVSLPSYCVVDEIYEIKIDVYYNGSESTIDRKHVTLWSDDAIELIRVGDDLTKCQVLSETSTEYGGKYNDVSTAGCLIDTVESTSLFFRLRPTQTIKKAGDYEGNVTFTVSVQ